METSRNRVNSRNHFQLAKNEVHALRPFPDAEAPPSFLQQRKHNQADNAYSSQDITPGLLSLRPERDVSSQSSPSSESSSLLANTSVSAIDIRGSRIEVLLLSGHDITTQVLLLVLVVDTWTLVSRTPDAIGLGPAVPEPPSLLEPGRATDAKAARQSVL